ncbi:MAG: glycosyltransferase [Isosphaeraceae bacterium]
MKLAAAPILDWLESRCRGPMEPGDVLIHGPSAAFQAPGGGECQLVQTARHLEAIGVEARPFVPWTDRLEQARLLHLFGMSREGLELARAAKARRIPVVLSPIFWFQPGAEIALADHPLRAAGRLLRWVVRTIPGPIPDWRRELVALADRLLPNSRAEAGQAVRYLGADRGRIRVVPNGVEARFGAIEPATGRDRVLFVGRIEPRKNLLGLIRAVRPTGLPLEVVGAVPPGREDYAGRCRREGQGFTLWSGACSHDDPSLEGAYARARVLALPSWFETPGLAALEAAMAGCAVVLTPFGSTREVFGERVEFARPGRPAEIRRAVQRAWSRGPDPALRSHVLRHFSWSMVARKTAEVYDEIAG